MLNVYTNYEVKLLAHVGAAAKTNGGGAESGDDGGA